MLRFDSAQRTTNISCLSGVEDNTVSATLNEPPILVV